MTCPIMMGVPRSVQYSNSPVRDNRKNHDHIADYLATTANSFSAAFRKEFATSLCPDEHCEANAY
jgi:hypothetical protein